MTSVIGSQLYAVPRIGKFKEKIEQRVPEAETKDE